MSEGLEALEKFDKLVKTYHEKIGLNENDLLGFGLLLKIIEKELKAFEIIKSKEIVSVFKDIMDKCFIVSNTTAIEIPQEEYDLLKEVLL